MMADLEDGDDQTRLDTATNLVGHPPAVDDARYACFERHSTTPWRESTSCRAGLCRLQKLSASMICHVTRPGLRKTRPTSRR